MKNGGVPKQARSTDSRRQRLRGNRIGELRYWRGTRRGILRKKDFMEAGNEGLNVSDCDQGNRISLRFAGRNRASVSCLANLATRFGLTIAVRVRQYMREHEDREHHQSERYDLVQAKTRLRLIRHLNDHTLSHFLVRRHRVVTVSNQHLTHPRGPAPTGWPSETKISPLLTTIAADTWWFCSDEHLIEPDSCRCYFYLFPLVSRPKRFAFSGHLGTD